MPEYLAPGVYVEETSFRSKSIEGVSTSTCAFVGPTRRGPVDGAPDLITTITDFQRIYGGYGQLALGGTDGVNHLALAVKAFFENGGGRLYVRRVFEANSNSDDGRAKLNLVGSTTATRVVLVARFPGRAGNGTVTFSETRSAASGQALDRLVAGTLVLVPGATPSDPPTVNLRTATGWTTDAGAAATAPTGSVEVCTLGATLVDADGVTQVLGNLAYHRDHPRYVGSALAETPTRRADFLQNAFAVTVGANVTAGGLRTALVGATGTLIHTLATGNDGASPVAQRYTEALADVARREEVSIVAAPGHSALTDAAGIRAALITHVEGRGMYRVAVLDSAPDDEPSEVQTTRSAMDTTKAALYFPWITVSNPAARAGDARDAVEVTIPPSGAVCGIYARNDVQNGVWKSPANEVVLGALRLEREISFGENELLNPLGINCLRTFSGRGIRVWGARTASSDPEWKYLSVRRYFHYLEASIERGTQWAVFEPNGPELWRNVTETIESFLYNEWRQGALLGETTKEAYFVRCDRTTMDQNDLDNGRLVCLIGVAVVKPAEFVIFRIGQKTASARD